MEDEINEPEKISWMTQGPEEIIAKVLESARLHLGMDVSFIAEFTAGRRVFRHVNGHFRQFGLEVGQSDAMEDTFCQLVLKNGDTWIPDTSADTLLPASVRESYPEVACYVGVPIRFSDGRLYGTMCSFSGTPTEQVGPQNLAFLRVLADMIAEPLELLERSQSLLRHQTELITKTMDLEDVDVALQPIVDLKDGEAVGFEALARFRGDDRTPDLWFKDAAAAGLGVELELMVIRKALRLAEALPEGTYLSINASPATIFDPRFTALIGEYDRARLLVEVTEHELVDNYDGIKSVLAESRAAGLRIAVDDVGAGFSSMRHILRLDPDILKLDRDLTVNVSTDPSEQALVAAMVGFAAKVGARVVAEGLETPEALNALRILGVGFAQGYLFGRPIIQEQASVSTQAAAAPSDVVELDLKAS